MTIAENRLIDLALTKLEVRMLNDNLSAEEVKDLIEVSKFPEIEINVVDYKNEYNIKNNAIYTDLALTAKKLYDEELIYYEYGDLVAKRWVITCKYSESRKSIAIQFHPDLIPQLLLFKSCYTKFDFDIKKYIKSYYACRFYELFKQYESFGVRTFYIDQLRFLLGIEDDEYPEYSNLKQRVISPSVKQINKTSDLYCEFKEIKVKRKVEKVQFRFVKQNLDFQTKTQLSFFEDEINFPKEGDNFNIVQDFKNLLGITISPRQIDKLIKLTSKSLKEHNLNMSIKEYINQKKIVVDEYGKNHDIKSYLGAINSAIKDNWTIQSVKSKGIFNDYEQRPFDPTLENKLLGWEQ